MRPDNLILRSTVPAFAVTGSSGFVGRHLVPSLAAQGRGVVAVARGLTVPLPAGAQARPVADSLLAALDGRAPRPPSLRQSLASSRRAPRTTQYLQAAAANLAGSRLASQLRALVQPARRSKQLHVNEIAKLVTALDQQSGDASRSQVVRARHPLSGVPLASVMVQPGKGVR